jgi:acylaminoacyl-peptidase
MNWSNHEDIKTITTDIPIFADATLPVAGYTGKHLICETTYKTTSVVCIVNLQDGKVNLLKFGKYESNFLLDQFGDYLLLNVQSPVMPFKVVLLKLKDGIVESETIIDQDVEVSKLVGDVTWSVHNVDSIEYIVVAPKSEEKNPMILNPHGGPHGNSTTLFRMETLCFVMHGYGVITVNYRGSTGYTKEFTECLPGHVGDWDVKDCYNALEHYGSQGFVDKNRLYYLGGSHGGFIGGHMVGQYPELFKAAILHNPVINMSVMVTTSDIPDWCWTEVGYDPYENEIVTVEYQEKAFKMSPIYYVNEVKTPMFLLIGDSDLRVPSEQGVHYFHALKKRGIDVKMNVYKDQGHPISDPQVSLDRVVSSLLWFAKYK